MTDPGSTYIPGQPAVPKMGYGMNAGMHHNVMTGVDDYALPANPLDAPEMAGEAPKEATPAPASPPAREGKIVGWRVRDSDGNIVAEMHNVNQEGSRKARIDAVGRSLYDQAITPDDKESAQRARAYGLSLINVVPDGEITKRMLQLYENDQRNLTSRSIQAEKSKRAAMRGTGGPGVGPTKADKFENQVDLDDAKLTEQVVNNEQAQAKIAAVRDYETDLAKLDALISSPNALSQRAAIAEYMKTLTGKQATDRERDQITGAAGMLAKLQNNLSLWSPTDASLSKAYINEFKSNVATLRAAVKARKESLGKEFSDRLTHQPRFAKKDAATKDALGKYGRGVATGDYGDAPQAAAPGKVDDDLLK